LKCAEAGLDVLVNVVMLMECLGCSRMSVYRRCKSGELPFVKIGGRVMFRRTDVEQWIAKNTHRVSVRDVEISPKEVLNGTSNQ